MGDLIKSTEFQMLFAVFMLLLLVSMTRMDGEKILEPSDEEKAGALLFKLLKILNKDK